MSLKRLLALAVFFVAPFFAQAGQARITVDRTGHIFRLDGGDVTYALAVDDDNDLRAIYWGGRLSDDETFAVRNIESISSFDLSTSLTPQEFPGQGAGLVTDPGLKITFPDGNRDLRLRFRSYAIDGETLTIRLTDIDRPVEVTLRYTIDPDTGVIGRSATVRNTGAHAFTIERIASAVVTLANQPDYRLYSLSGRWAGEFTLNTQPVTPTLAVLESRRGMTSHQHTPWFAIDRAGVSSEEHGPVWFGALAWSGSWRISVGRDALGRVEIAGGYNPYDFSWRLHPGETLDTPVFYIGYSDHGMGGASRTFHRFQRAHILPHDGHKVRPVVYDSWEATYFKVTEAGQMALAEKAARLGVERFVLDDGWFANRNDAHSGLGDWYVDRTKFPHGLTPLIDKVHALGMEFGLWVEPEMVDKDSDLYRKHPDWVINFAGRPRTEGRNELVLNLARPEVRDYVLNAIDRLLDENDVQFLKWDANRAWTEPGWPEAAPADQQRLYVDYVRNLYAIMDELRRRHPGLEIQACAGGGGRVDLGIMQHTDEVWPSDNTDPFDRLAIQDGFTHAYTPAAMMAWVTDSPNWANNRTTSLAYRFLSSMQGGLGIGADLNKWTDDDFKVAAKMIADYKTISQTVQHGSLYRLIRPLPDNETSATLYVSQDRKQAVLFQMLHSSSQQDNPARIQLRGLDPDRIYTVRMIGGDPVPDTIPASATGRHWMQWGLSAPLVGDYQGAGFILEAKR